MPVPTITASPIRNASIMTASKGYATIDCTDDGENGFPRLAHAARATCLWLSGLRAKHGVLPLLAHEVRPCLVYGEAVLEVG